MKKKFLSVGIFIAAFGVALTSCTISDKKNNASEVNATMIDQKEDPVIEFENQTFEIGSIAVGETVEHEFKFTNTGEGVLIIHDIKPSCGCTALKNWPKHPINPGETGIIPIEFTPNMSGPVKKTVSIICNANPSVQKVFIKGEAIGV